MHFDSIYQAAWVPKTIPTLIFSGEKDAITPISYFLQKKEYSRNNITIDIIEEAAHFPWIENPKKVTEIFLMHFHKIQR